MRRHSPKTILLATLLGGASLAPANAQTVPSGDPPRQSPIAPNQPANGSGPTSNPVLIITPVPAPGASPAAQPTEKADAKQGAGDVAALTTTTNTDQTAFFEAHLAALHAGLTLTPDQEKLWPPLEQAIRGVADLQRKEHRTAGAAQSSDDEAADQSSSSKGEDAIATLKQVSTRMVDRGTALGALADASGPLYETLTDEQKGRLPVLLEGLTPRRGPVARMVKALLGDLKDDESGMRGDRHEERPQDMRRGDRDQNREEGPGDRGARSRMRQSEVDEDRDAQHDDYDAQDRSSYGRRSMDVRRDDRFDENGSFYSDRDAGRRDRPTRRGRYDDGNNGRYD